MPVLHKALTVVRHLMRLLLTLILLFTFGLSHGQNFSYPAINLIGQTLNDFLPTGWTMLDSAKGDLNKDGIIDAVLIIQLEDSITLIKSEDTIITQPRILLFLFKSKSDKLFHLIETSNTFILSHDNSQMDDPFQGMIIDKGVLKIKFHLFYNMGSWYTTSSTYKFRYDGRLFILIGADLSTIHRVTLDYEDYSYNFLTNEQTYTKGNEKNGRKKTTLKSLIKLESKNLKNFTKPYSWEIEDGLFL